MNTNNSDHPKTEFLQALSQGLNDGSFLRITLGKYRGDSDLTRVQGSCLQLKAGPSLSLTYKYQRRDEVKNYSFEEGIEVLATLLGTDFLAATLFTVNNDYVLEYSKKRVSRLYRKPPSLANSTEAKTNSHNREKNRLLDPSRPFFQELGISDINGNVRGEKYDKYRQIEKFVEILAGLIESSALKNKDEISLIDYGSGKNYLTFAVYDYLTQTLKKTVRATGVELRPELATSGNKLAQECNFNGLCFEQGQIGSYEAKCDVMVALHACDTASDDALFQAIKAEVPVIVIAPCCHKYVRKQLQVPADLKPIFKHGILEEQLAVSLSDGLRALVLQSYGYNAKVFEFISSEHTSKNLMITAVKSNRSDNERAKQEIRQIKERFGLADFYLDRLLGL